MLFHAIICVCMWVRVCLSVIMCAHVCLCVCVCVYVCVCLCMCLCICLYVCVCLCACMWVWVYVRVCVCACMCVYVFLCDCVLYIPTPTQPWLACVCVHMHKKEFLMHFFIYILRQLDDSCTDKMLFQAVICVCMWVRVCLSVITCAHVCVCWCIWVNLWAWVPSSMVLVHFLLIFLFACGRVYFKENF